MIDNSGNKYLQINLFWTDEVVDGDIVSDWMIVNYNEMFMYTRWFSPFDYEIYQPYEIKEKFFKKTTKLNEKKLVNKGFIKVKNKSYDWLYNWILDLLNINPLTKFFDNLAYEEKERLFEELERKAWIWDEVQEIIAYWELKFAIEWCEDNGIPYKIDMPENYPQSLPKSQIKKRIIEKMQMVHFEGKLSFINKIWKDKKW